MKSDFKIGSSVKLANRAVYGRLVVSETTQGKEFMPHYVGQGFYCVRWNGRSEIRIVHEDDLVLVEDKLQTMMNSRFDSGSESASDRAEMARLSNLLKVQELLRESCTGWPATPAQKLAQEMLDFLYVASHAGKR